MNKRKFFIRNFEAVNLIENFFVAAVAAVLGIRLFLRATGYPQLSGGGLHIAHMLWGGLLMLAAIVILIAFLGRASRSLAAILGGIGFGTFIDEVGKFVTKDNDYFFEPTVAVIYVTFSLIFIAFRAVQTGRSYSKEEYLMNALREMEEVALGDLDQEEKNRALYFLSKSDPRDALVVMLKKLLSGAELVPSPTPGLYTRLKVYLRDRYYKVAGLRLFPTLVIAFFLFQLMVKLSYAVVLLFFVGLGWDQLLNFQTFEQIAQKISEFTFVEWAELVSSLLSGVFVFLGVFYIRRSRLSAFRMFELSILISIFLTQVFTFYQEQFAALAGLFFNILILVALKYMIEREKSAASEASQVESLAKF